MSLVTFPRQFLVDLNGTPRVGAKASFYQAGTDSLITVYTTPDLDVPHTNPVLSNAGGLFPAVYVDEGDHPTYKLLITDSADVPIPGYPEDNIPASGLTQASVGAALYPLSEEFEEPLGLTNADIDSRYGYGLLERYRAAGDGSTDDSTALTNAALVAAQGIEIHGTPGKTYLWTSEIAVTGQFRLDLHGATLKPSGNARFRRYAPSGTAVTTVSSGATIGSRVVVVASAASLVVGQWVQIEADDSPTHDAGSYPSWWCKIDNIAGTTITVDHPAPVTYGGTITFRAYTPSLILSRFEVSNGRIDGSAATFAADTGMAFRVGGYEEVVLDNLTFKNFDHTGAFVTDLQVVYCLDVTLSRLRWEGGVHDSASNVADVQNVRSVSLMESTFDGSHFGINLTRAETARAVNNTLIGRREKEGAGGNNSTRGLKMFGCATAIMHGNYSCDFESSLKIQACFQYIVTGNHVRNDAPTLAYSGEIGINIGSITNGTNMRRGIVANNIVENTNGVGIGISSDSTAGGVLVQGNITSRNGGMGIFVNVNNATIIGNRVEDWGLRNSSDVGIWYSQGATVIGNRFSHATLTSLACLRNFLQSTYKYHIDGNIAETANPIGITLESFGTGTIASGATNTGAIAHGLSRTPNAAEFVLTLGGNPTNDPGIVYLSSIGATNFQINVRADPGASGANIGWRAKIQQPFTA